MRASMPGVVNIIVHDGERVTTGQVLARISDAVDAQPGRSDADITRETLTKRRDLIDERLSLGERRIEQLRSIAALRIENAQNSINSLAEQIAMIETEVELARDALVRTRDLSDKALSTRGSVDVAQTNLLNAERALIEAKTSRIAAVADLGSTQLTSESEVSLLREEMIGLRA